MKANATFSLKKAKYPVLFLLTLLISNFVLAQAPTSLTYPVTNVYVTNVSSVYLAPSVAGDVSSYSITPALPAGLSFNTNTGVITGVPSAASATTAYVVTATGGTPSGSDTASFTIRVNNNYFDNNYADVKFGGPGVTITPKVGTGTSVGNIVLYENVANLAGQQIDAIVTTKALSNVSFTNYDQPATSGQNFSNNDPRFFSPQVTFPMNTTGYMDFGFQFIFGGSYNNATNTGTPVVLQNVRINTYDIDGNTGSNSEQYNEFGGFNTSELGNPTGLFDTLNLATELTTFKSKTTANTMSVIDPTTRVRVTYTNISDFTIRFGGGNGAAYFFLDFGTGSTFATAVSKSAPSIDLNTTRTGVGNSGLGCGSTLSFTPAGQTNMAAVPPALNEMTVRFPTASILNGANEKLLISGGTPANASSINLNFTNGASIPFVTIGGITYTVTATVSGGTSELTFRNGSGTFTVTQAEALLDAFQYNNTASTPTNGDRNFTVNVRNTEFLSPNAVFTATLNCVAISGNVYHDVNGLTDSTVNANGTQFAANGAYVLRVNPADNKVIDSRGIAAGGAYNFGTVTAGTYILYVSNNDVAAGTVVTAPTYPAGGYTSIGENLGAGAGNDLSADGKLIVTVGSISVTNANFGIEIPPTTSNNTINSIANPGGFNGYTIPNGSFTNADADGTVSSITITSFPTDANYLKVGTTVYTNGGTCPPQSTCTPWPGSVTVPVSSGNPTQSISVDPAAEGNTTVTVPFIVKDNGGLNSNSSTLTLNFVGTSYYNVSGKVWNDANANGMQNGVEDLTAPAGSSQTLYAVLVQKNNTYSGAYTILRSATVSAASGYSFTNVPGGNDYEVRIISLATAPEAGAAASTVSPALAPGWVGVSTNNNGTIDAGLSTDNPINTLNNLSANRTNVNFGIERAPVADDKAFTANNSAFTLTPGLTIGGQPSFAINAASAALTGSAQKSLSGSDPEDCAAASSCNSGKVYQIRSVRSNTRLFYDFPGTGVQEVTDVANSKITNFDPARLTIYGKKGDGYTDATALGFTYSIVDNGGIKSAPANYVLKSADAPLPVELISFSGSISNCVAVLNWKTASERNSSHYEVEQSNDGASFATAARVQSRNSTTGADYTATIRNLAAGTFFRLKMVDLNGEQAYSNVVRLEAGNCSQAVSVWPNPAHNIVKVGGLSGNNRIVISNALGMKMTTLSTTGSTATIDISAYAPGTYLVQVMSAEGELRSTVKLIKP